MTPEEKIARLEQALNEPEGKYTHDQIRAKIDTLRPALTGAPPEVAARRKGLSLAEQQARTHQPGEGQQPLDYIPGPAPQESFGKRIGHFAQGVKALGSAVAHPVDTVTTPQKRRELLRGVDDMVTLGYGQDLAEGARNRVLGVVPPFNRRGVEDALGPSLRETSEADAAAAPGYRTGGGIVGIASPGAASTIAKAGTKVAGKAIPLIEKTGMSGAGLGAAKAIVGYQASAPVIAGAHAESAGDRLGAARGAATDPLGLMLSGALGAAGGAGRGRATSIRDPKTESGRVLADVAAAGGKVKKFGQPVEGGLFETPALKNLPEGRVGANQLAEQATGRIVAANRARLKQARTEFGDAVDDVIMAHGDKPHPTTNAHRALDAMEAENTVNGVVGDEGVGNAINKVRRMLTQPGVDMNQEATLANVMRKTGIPPTARLNPQAIKALLAQAGPEDIVATPRQQITAGDMVKARKLVRKLANNAADPSGNRVYEIVIGAMDEDAALIDPRIREMNRNFSKAMEPIEQTNDMLFGKARKDIDFTEAERNTAVGRLGRIGDDTQAATTRRLDDRLAEITPENAAEVRLMRAKKAQERLRRGEPETSTAIEKSLRRGPNYGGRAIGGVFGGPVGFGLGYAADKYRENPLANKVRLGLPASETAGRLTGRSGVGVDVVTRLAASRGKKKKQEKDRAQAAR